MIPVVMAAIMPIAVFLPVFPLTTVFTAPARMLMLVAFTHPLLLHKVHRLSAGVVTGAMFSPILLMAHWYVEVDRLALHRHWRRYDDHGLWRNQHRLRVVANIDTAINARLVDANRDTDAGLGQYLTADSSAGKNGNHSEFFHHGLSK